MSDGVAFEYTGGILIIIPPQKKIRGSDAGGADTKILTDRILPLYSRI